MNAQTHSLATKSKHRISSAVYNWLYAPGQEKTRGASFEGWLSILILANIGCMLAETMPAFDAYHHKMHVFENISMGVFILEYVVRLFIASADPEFTTSRFPRLKYIFSFFALIDLAVIVPFFLAALLPIDLRALRIVRLLRLFKLLRVLIPAFNEFVRLNKGRTFRQRVHALVFESRYGGDLHHYFDMFIVFWVLISVLAVILESVDSIFYNLALEFAVIDAAAVFVFSIEYLMRLYSCVEEPGFQERISGRFRYAKKPSPLIDFLAILPFFLEVFLHHLLDLRFLRSFRLMRLFKLARYSGSMSSLVGVVRRELPIITTSCFCMMLLVVLVASLGYLFEHDAQPEKFENIPTTIYWAVITLASVGYGDLSPITPFGRAMTSVMALMGIGIFAIPASILSSAFMQEMQSQRQRVENELSLMLADGVLSDEELANVREHAARINMSPQQLDVLIEKTRREAQERATNDLFIPDEFLVKHTEIAMAQFNILYEQMNRLAQLPNAGDMTERLEASKDTTATKMALWQILKTPPSAK